MLVVLCSEFNSVSEAFGAEMMENLLLSSRPLPALPPTVWVFEEVK